jgi:NitT/TauT family transport system ATP-binding protein
MNIIEAKRISLSYYDESRSRYYEVISDISLSVEKGTIVSIMGPSGCGKTTLIKILAGLLAPSAGEIRVDGNLIQGPCSDRTVIFQEYGLFDWKTVFQNVEFGLKAKNINKEKRKSLSMKFIEIVHLKGFERIYPYALSGGMKQRAAIARALAVDPKCILMDEPFAALDSQTKYKLLGDILEIWEKTKHTIIHVTHDVEEALFFSNRILLLSDVPSKIAFEIEVPFKRPRIEEDRTRIPFYELSKTINAYLRKLRIVEERQK